MEEKNKRPFGPQDGGQQRDRQPRRRGFSWFSMIYLILLLGLVYMWSSTGTANPLKKEWLDVKETLLVSGDVEKLVYVRNEHKGEIYLKQGALDKYKNLYGGREPKGGPHFYFLVSEKFDAEEQLDTLVESLPGDKQFKVVVEEHKSYWGPIIEWILFPLMLLLMFSTFMVLYLLQSLSSIFMSTEGRSSYTESSSTSSGLSSLPASAANSLAIP